MPLILIYDIILISMKRIFTIFTLLFAVLFSSNDVSAQSLSDLLEVSVRDNPNRHQALLRGIPQRKAGLVTYCRE